MTDPAEETAEAGAPGWTIPYPTSNPTWVEGPDAWIDTTRDGTLEVQRRGDYEVNVYVPLLVVATVMRRLGWTVEPPKEKVTP